MSRRRRRRDAAVLLAVRAGERYGFDIAKATRMSAGSVYPSLFRLEAQGLIGADWEISAGRRRRAYTVRGASPHGLPLDGGVHLETMGQRGPVESKGHRNFEAPS